MDQYDSDGLGGLFDVPDQVLLDAQAPRRPVVESALPPVRGDRAELLIASGTLPARAGALVPGWNRPPALMPSPNVHPGRKSGDNGPQALHNDRMVDRHFSRTELAELYDYFNHWNVSPQNDFYIDLVMQADSVLDVGCGTGKLHRVARERGHTGRLVGLDPAEAMLEVGRRDRDDVEWILGDLVEGPYDGETEPLKKGTFDLIIMSGHAFQVFITDEELRANLASIRRILSEDGRFVFETRNPAVRGWQAWSPERVRTVDGPEGRRATCVHRLREVQGDLVTFTSDYSVEDWDEPQVSRSTLRFPDAETVNGFLAEASLRVSAQYGYWDRSPLTEKSAEIITFARPA